MKTVQDCIRNKNQEFYTIDLYSEIQTLKFPEEKIKEYQDLINWSTHIYFVSPVWWFRTTPLLESFFDQIFTPGFAYKFVPLTKYYGYPKPLLKDKKVRTYLTHGAPSLPVLTLYVNSVKLRLVMGVYSFVFGWFRTKTRQFWSVPFVSQNDRMIYLEKIKDDLRQD